MEHWRFIGDQLDTRENIKRAERELNIHRDLVRLGNLSQNKSKRVFGDGLVVECQTVFKDEIIRVYKNRSSISGKVEFTKDYSIIPVIYVYDGDDLVGYYIARDFIMQVFKGLPVYREKGSSDTINIGTYFKYGATIKELGVVIELEDVGEDLLRVYNPTSWTGTISDDPDSDTERVYPPWHVNPIHYFPDGPVELQTTPYTTVFYSQVGYAGHWYWNIWSDYFGYYQQAIGCDYDGGPTWGYITMTKDTIEGNRVYNIHLGYTTTLFSFPDHRTVTERTWGVQAVYAPIERNSVAKTEATYWTESENSSGLYEEKNKYILLTSYIDNSGVYYENLDTNDIEFDGGTTYANTDRVEQEPYPLYLKATIDDGSEFIIYKTDTSEYPWEGDFWSTSDVFKVNDDLMVYMYSAFCTHTGYQKMIYGFIFQGKHHRLLFDATMDTTSDWVASHDFTSATYISPNGTEKEITFPSIMSGLIGRLVYGGDRDYTACKALNNIKKEVK